MTSQVNFETSVKRLQEIVDALEQGQVDLDDSIKIFEEGLKLVQDCNKKLSAAESKIRKLIKTEDGLQLSFLDPENLNDAN